MIANRRATKIMFIRHGEKPTSFPKALGVTPSGEHDKDSLSVRGWQRAGALVSLFDPPSGIWHDPLIERPQFLFASKPTKNHGSRRPFETLMPLSEKLGIRINSQFAKVQSEEMIDAALQCDGTVLISWNHENIVPIAERILLDSVPEVWPEDVYDVIWVFDRDPLSDRYQFNQVSQNLLFGDTQRPTTRRRIVLETEIHPNFSSES